MKIHYLLIQQLIIDEVAKLVQAQGFKALEEAKFDYRLLQQNLIEKGLNTAQIDKWVAYLHIGEYIKITALDHTRNPTFISLTPKGMAAETSKYFKEQYDDHKKQNWKYWVDTISQTIVGITAIIAILLSTKSCNKEDSNKCCPPAINIYNTIPETKSFSTPQTSTPDTSAKKLTDTVK